MSRKRTSRKRRTKIPNAPKEAREIGEQGQYLEGRIKKISLKKLISGRISKKRVKVSS